MSEKDFEIQVDKKEGVARVRETSHSIAQHRLGKWEKAFLNYFNDVYFDTGMPRIAVSRKQLADIFGGSLTRRNVAIVLRSLEKKGFISREHQIRGSGQHLENIYTITHPRIKRSDPTAGEEV